MSIELRLSDIDPPTPEPKRTIYRDIVNLPDPVKLGLTIRYFNHDDVGLYFQITGSGAGYTFGTVNLGLLAAGANAYRNLDEFASRAKPSASDLPNGEMEENITLILKAYTDSGYSNLKWTYERTVTVHWINSVDSAWTVDVLNNFDDGTVQGWAVADETGNDTGLGYPAIGVATDYVLSPPYSLIIRQQNNSTSIKEVRARLYKSFTTPNKDKVFAIFDIRNRQYSADYPRSNYIKITRDDTTLVFIGKPHPSDIVAIPVDKWIRIVVPLPKNTTLELRIIQSFYKWDSGGTTNYPGLRLDDFKIISK
jgi:hypothetical protein